MLFAVIFTMIGVACDDFYSDSLPTPDIAQPTPVSVSDGDPVELVQQAARNALAVKLGIAGDDSRQILLQGETWTDRNPGCYPPPAGISGPYLVPGYRLLLQHDGVFYEFNADLGGSTGALCESTPQLVPVEAAGPIVRANGSALPDLDSVHILRSEEDVTEFNSTHSDIATITPDVIDWEVEWLVGGWVDAFPGPEPTRAYQSGEEGVVIIEVEAPLEFAGSASNVATQVWALVDKTKPDSTYKFVAPEP